MEDKCDNNVQQWEVKPFFATSQSRGRENKKVLQSFSFPYTDDSVSLDQKFLYHLDAEGSQPRDSSGMLLDEEISCLLTS